MFDDVDGAYVQVQVSEFAGLGGTVETVRHSLERLLRDPRKRFMVIVQSLVFQGKF